ncbi:uncharacterized protein LOC125028199 isoform X3 [Penaeus chinensis]|uniref:uncharacterized protein LOC125028199 isoform X3 n=1 Tax=Penaeus chinensis TaxID=139456 RepID=UPI001FB7A52E|nr:uncharacterized protein LOC125028199 isoform X3 [Penaeus chinensis]
MPEIAGPGQDQYEARGGRTCIFSLAAAMLSLVAVLSLASLARAAPEPLEVSESLSLDNGLNRGDWGPIELCQTRSFAYGFQIKYQDLGFVDDTAANGLKLYCRDGLGATTGYITSLVGNHGTWRNILQCPSSAYVEGVRAYVLPDQGSMHDDLGVDNVQLWCSEGTILDGKNWLTARAAAAPADELLARAEEHRGSTECGACGRTARAVTTCAAWRRASRRSPRSRTTPACPTSCCTAACFRPTAPSRRSNRKSGGCSGSWFGVCSEST